jgi:predicted membrane protein
MRTALMNVCAIIILGCFTALEIVMSLIMIQLEPKHVGEYML